ncbi:Bug family tripartite tricarboxylate transporter substrate binding protein [Caenispirillum salinarum]|uniref:Bug family tripartite tricarboxylate transporter substrate binding protein n=1 Tax=Caenispirillum salinarum TaxID=859058 RepID=UPI00384FF4D7
MKSFKSLTRRAVLGGIAAAGLFAVSGLPGVPAHAQEDIDTIHFLIPGGAGGGWDSTARAIGMTMKQEGLIKNDSYENMSGAGGGKAIGYLIETADRQENTLMVNSTPIIVRSLTKIFPYSYRDVTPVARVIGDYQILAVQPDSEIKTFEDVLERFREDPRSVKIAGGSVRGDLDHLVPASAFRAAGEDPRQVAYVPYDAGGKALAGFLSGETELLSTGLGEAIGPHRDGQLRIIAVSAPERVEVLPDVPTFKESGADIDFANWRGVFGAPGISDERKQAFATKVENMMETETWEEIRAKNGWQNLYLPPAEFTEFLAKQEEEMGELMREMGFLR